jgi:hypothetical protein
MQRHVKVEIRLFSGHIEVLFSGFGPYASLGPAHRPVFYEIVQKEGLPLQLLEVVVFFE